MTDEVVLIAAVLAAPEDDAPRLVFADWLEERERFEEVPCPSCAPHHADPENPWGAQPGYYPERDPASGRHEGGWTNCKTCNGGGNSNVSSRKGFLWESNGCKDRADFIRVQCELARCYKTVSCCTDLRRRERELFSGEWFPTVPSSQIRLDSQKSGGHSVEMIVRRGFVEAVTCTTAAFLGGECPSCSGVGDDGGRAESHTLCPACRGTGTAGGCAAGLFAAYPITSVRLTDKSPWQQGDSVFIWFPERDARPFQHPQSDIPDEIFDRMDAFQQYNPRLLKRYSTQEFAHAALSRACEEYGKAAARKLKNG